MKKTIKNLTLFLCLTLSCSANPLWDINDGIKLFRNNSFEDCKNYFIDYIDNNPNDEESYFWLAKSYSKLNEEEKARELFKKSYELIIQTKDLEKGLMETFENQTLEDYFDMAVMYFENDNLKQSKYYADLMLKINPKSSSAYFIKAKIAYVQGDKEEATSNINQAIIYNNNILNTNLAKALKVDKIPSATKEFYYNYAWEKYFKGDIKGAIENSEKYLEENTSNTEMRNFLTELYLKDDNLLLAQQNVEAILKETPINSSNLLNQAKIYILKNEYDKAESALKEAYKYYPNNKDVLYRLAEFYFNKEDYKNSKKYYQTAIEVDNSFYESYRGLIDSLIELNEIDSAIDYIRKAIALNPKNSDISYLLAKICILKGEYNDAFNYLEEALKKDDNILYYLDLAKINYILGKYKQSLINLEDINLIKYNDKNDGIIDIYYIKNYSKLYDIKALENYINRVCKFDKDNIIYKYNMYMIYKVLDNKEKLSFYSNQLKKIKANKIEEYIVLSNFLSEEQRYKEAQKLLDEGLKKHKNSYELLSQKKILEFLQPK